jgi:cbb3-type cytochrome oxidase maturation protein
MTILLLLVPISVLLLGIAVWALLWAVRSGQYDDLDAPAIDMLRSDVASPRPSPSPSDAD